MQFTLENSGAGNLFRGYEAGAVRIGERTLRRSCLVTVDRVVEDWRPVTVAELRPDDAAAVLALEPEIVLLGTGTRQEFPPAAFRQAFAARGVGLDVMDVGAACRTFNVLVQEERRVLAALLLDPRGGASADREKTQGE